MPLTPLHTVVRIDPPDWIRLGVGRGDRVQVVVDDAEMAGIVTEPLKIDLGERVFAARASVVVRRPRRLITLDRRRHGVQGDPATSGSTLCSES